MLEPIVTLGVLGAIYLLVDFINTALLNYFRKRWLSPSHREWNALTTPAAGTDDYAMEPKTPADAPR